MKVPLYYLWTDTMFYVYCTAFIMSLASLIYSIRGYLELANAAPYDEEIPDTEAMAAAAEAEAIAPAEELPVGSADLEKTVVVSNIEELISGSVQEAQAGAQAPAQGPEQAEPAAQADIPALAEEQADEPPAQEPAQQPARQEQAEVRELASRDNSKAEEFVKGIYDHISHIDSRLDLIETSVAKKNVNGEFAMRFLEDMMTDFDTLNREKIKARIQFLISDLKK